MRLRFHIPYRALAAALLVVGGLALSPGRAEGTCGSYVVVEDATPVQHDMPEPCHGPGCSRAPATPVIPLTVPAGGASVSEQSSLAFETDGVDCSGAGWACFRTVADRPVRLRSVIFHPPRAS